MIEFASGNIWTALRAAARRSTRPAAVAVAYFGKGASKHLPLPAGSRLVVDATESAVKSGQTCPAELKRLLLKRGVIVYSVGNLHAKVFVLGSTAFVGSANASNHSANTLIEALVCTTDPQVVKAARTFVQDLCLQELGPEELDRLQGIYRPPRGPLVNSLPLSRKKRTPALDRLRIVQLERQDWPEGAEGVQEAGTTAAKKHMSRPRRHLLDDFFWTGKCPVQLGENVVQIVKEHSGARLVDPPARVVHMIEWQKGLTKYTFVYLERAKRRRMEVRRLAKRIGRGSAQKLRRGGLVSRDFAAKLLAAWNR